MPRKGPARRPHFFKVLLGDFAKRLRIPPKFMKHLPNEAAKVAILQSPSGRSWRVEVGKNVNGTNLLRGWPEFVSAHTLREHDFLVFRYDGDMHFSVMIFDTSACEREYASTKDKGKSKTLVVSEGRHKHGRPLATKKKWLMLPTNDKHANNHLQEHGAITVLDEQGKIISSPKPKKHARITLEGAISPISIDDSNAIWSKDYTSRIGKSKAQQAAEAFSSMFPYFISRMTSSKVSNRYMLIIPSRFSREHLPPGRIKVVLQDPCRKAWETSCIQVRKDHYLSKGWADFVRGNSLEEGDYCAFELHGTFEFCVSIFREH